MIRRSKRKNSEERLKLRKVPEEVMKVIREGDGETWRLADAICEYAVCRNYIDWLTIVPWGINSAETHDLKKAGSDPRRRSLWAKGY